MRIAMPTTVTEAAELLALETDAKVFAGATDLIPQMRSGRPEPGVLIDLKRIERLTSIDLTGSTWTVGAAVPTARLTTNDTFTAAFPGLAEASGLIGSDQIQNRSSWGGNLCNASPAADSVPSLIVNHAQAIIASSNGERRMDVNDIVVGPGQTSLAADEFVVEFQIERPPPFTADAYIRMTPRTEMDIAVVGAAVRLTMDGDKCSAASVALGAVAPTAIRIEEASAALVGSSLGDAALQALALACTAACRPIDDRRGTADYRRQVAGVLARRATHLAARRAGGSVL